MSEFPIPKAVDQAVLIAWSGTTSSDKRQATSDFWRQSPSIAKGRPQIFLSTARNTPNPASSTDEGTRQPENRMQTTDFGPLIRSGRTWIFVVPFALVSVCAAAQLVGDETAFTAENAAAMDKMMAGMEVPPSGDVDRDFAAMMIPHHQGAIDMALAELRHGRNERLRRIAQEIVVEQQQEIDAMHLAVGQPPSPPAPTPTQAGLASSVDPHDAPSAAHVHHVH